MAQTQKDEAFEMLRLLACRQQSLPDEAFYLRLHIIGGFDDRHQFVEQDTRLPERFALFLLSLIGGCGSVDGTLGLDEDTRVLTLAELRTALCGGEFQIHHPRMNLQRGRVFLQPASGGIFLAAWGHIVVPLDVQCRRRADGDDVAAGCPLSLQQTRA